jgi:hypothetical protein
MRNTGSRSCTRTAGRGEVLTRNAASETGTSTAEMAPAKAAAQASATAEAADVSAAD